MNLRIAVTTNNSIEFLTTEDILFIEADRNHSILYTTNNRKLKVIKSLSDFENKLNDDVFIRVHKSYIININHVCRYVKSDSGYIEIVNGNKILISRRKRGFFTEVIEKNLIKI